MLCQSCARPHNVVQGRRKATGLRLTEPRVLLVRTCFSLVTIHELPDRVSKCSREHEPMTSDAKQSIWHRHYFTGALNLDCLAVLRVDCVKLISVWYSSANLILELERNYERLIVALERPRRRWAPTGLLPGEAQVECDHRQRRIHVR